MVTSFRSQRIVFFNYVVLEVLAVSTFLTENSACSFNYSISLLIHCISFFFCYNKLSLSLEIPLSKWWTSSFTTTSICCCIISFAMLSCAWSTPLMCERSHDVSSWVFTWAARTCSHSASSTSERSCCVRSCATLTRSNACPATLAAYCTDCDASCTWDDSGTIIVLSWALIPSNCSLRDCVLTCARPHITWLVIVPTNDALVP